MESLIECLMDLNIINHPQLELELDPGSINYICWCVIGIQHSNQRISISKTSLSYYSPTGRPSKYECDEQNFVKEAPPAICVIWNENDVITLDRYDCQRNHHYLPVVAVTGRRWEKAFVYSCEEIFLLVEGKWASQNSFSSEDPRWIWRRRTSGVGW